MGVLFLHTISIQTLNARNFFGNRNLRSGPTPKESPWNFTLFWYQVRCYRGESSGSYSNLDARRLDDSCIGSTQKWKLGLSRLISPVAGAGVLKLLHYYTTTLPLLLHLPHVHIQSQVLLFWDRAYRHNPNLSTIFLQGPYVGISNANGFSWL